jgi:molybdopterin molybdotransferase
MSPRSHETPVEYEEARRLILERVVSGRSSEDVPIVESLGYVLAEDVRSPINMPAFNRAAMDGFAFRHADTEEGDTYVVTASLAAGEAYDIEIGRGQCVQIMTGAPVPAGADTVIPVEKTEALEEDKIRFLSVPSRGMNIAFKGEDVQVGKKVLPTGHLIRSQEIAILAGLGRPTVRIYSGPQVAFAATGEELVEPGGKLQPGRIYNSNAYSLWSQVLRAGAKPHYLGVIRDNRKDLRQKIRKGLGSDILILSGGVSMGRFDLVPEILSELGVEILFSRLLVKPGQPTVFGVRGETLVFGLPGNPIATTYAFDQYVAPAVRSFRKHPQPLPTRYQGELTESVRTKTGFVYLIPCATEWRDARYYLTPFKPHGSADIFGIAGADALAQIPSEVEQADAGETVSFHKLYEL